MFLPSGLIRSGRGRLPGNTLINPSADRLRSLMFLSLELLISRHIFLIIIISYRRKPLEKFFYIGLFWTLVNVLILFNIDMTVSLYLSFSRHSYLCLLFNRLCNSMTLWHFFRYIKVIRNNKSVDFNIKCNHKGFINRFFFVLLSI